MNLSDYKVGDFIVYTDVNDKDKLIAIEQIISINQAQIQTKIVKSFQNDKSQQNEIVFLPLNTKKFRLLTNWEKIKYL